MDRSRPRVVVHVAVSLDGATSGFEVDIARYYELVSSWDEDVTLAGADTIIAQEQALASAPRPGPSADAPLLAVVDGRRRVRQWEALRSCGHWRDAVALRAEGGEGARAGEPVRELTAGRANRVDLARALELLGEREGARTIRVDSGPTLIGALLRRGLVDELSLLMHPCLAADAGGAPWHGGTDLRPLSFGTHAVERLENGLVWLRFQAAGPRPGPD
jgi:2,5-diamino-6-(ribosylamino)-4(3H)-pyrimidinone 5'-phosphate reductase